MKSYVNEIVRTAHIRNIHAMGGMSAFIPGKNAEENDEILRKQYNLMCTFIFTLTKDEMELNQFSERDNFISVGTINVNQCPSFYQHIDALIFPSLLESFSVTPLEAMFMKKQVIASDRAFIRNVCLDYAYYFDPMDSKSIASVINQYFLNKSNDLSMIESAHEHAMSFSSAKNRAEKYLEIINTYHDENEY